MGLQLMNMYEFLQLAAPDAELWKTFENAVKMTACKVPLDSSAAYWSMICSGSLSKGRVLIFTQRSPAVVGQMSCAWIVPKIFEIAE